MSNRKPKGSSNNICLNINNEIISDPIKVATHLNKFYTSVAQKLTEKIKPGVTKFNDYLKISNANSFFIRPTCSKEIKNILHNIDHTKSSDVFGLSPKIIKNASEYLSEILTEMFNSSFENGTFPNLMTFACVIPIFKGGSRFDVSNYRPVSLLPVISKIIEKLMHERLMRFLKSNNILYENQYGFQKSKSTTLAILDMCDKIINAFEKKEYACNVFLDFAKAFDTVNHEILISKLEFYGIL